MLVDKYTIQQVLGSLIKHPQYLGQSDRYNLSQSDFTSRFEKYLFWAIYNLYEQGLKTIQIGDIENYLRTNTAAIACFESNHGIEYLQDLEVYAEESNFDFYYRRLKKLNLLKEYEKFGIDISEFYEEDLTKPHALEINQNFEQLTTQQITETVKKKILGIESKYLKQDATEVESAAEGMEGLIESFSDGSDIGAPIQGLIINEILSGARKGTLCIRSAASGTGKALPNSSKIPTPTGWREVGEIKVGDYLFDAFGKPTKVLNVYPQGKKRVYKIEFKDGRSVRCCNEHLWSFNTSGQRESSILNRKFYTKTLKEIMKMPLKKGEGWDIFVPMQKAVEYKKNNHFIPPYLMGLFLGDGSFRQHKNSKAFQFSSADDILPSVIAKTMGWQLKRGSKKGYAWYFGYNFENHQNVWVEDVLIEHPSLFNTKSEDKFIPRVYIEDSIENRYQLLNGLLDSDGSVNEQGSVSYFTVSPYLVRDVEEICQSLGFKTSISLDTHKPTNNGYVLHITGTPEDKVKLFNLPRKKQIIKNWYQTTKRKEKNLGNPIVNIIDLGYEEEMTCFYVDNKEHLFLAENFVVTHNTRQSVGDACFLAYPIRYDSKRCEWIREGSCEKVLFIATEQNFDEIRRMILAYLTDINESKFRYGQFSEREKKVLSQAVELMKQYEENFYIVRMPNPTIELVKLIVRENCLTKDIGYVFYDYIFIGPSLLNEFRGFNLRNDKLLSCI